MSTGRQEAFEIFKRDYADNHIIDDQKLFLKKGYAEAKMLGEKINTSRNKISLVKFLKKYLILYFELFKMC